MEGEIVSTAVANKAIAVAQLVRIASFRGRPMILKSSPYPHFVPLRREDFDRIAYPILGGLTRGQMGDVFAYLSNTAEDLTDNGHLIAFGIGDRARVWDTRRLAWVDVDPALAIWRSPFAVVEEPEPIPFVLSLAGGNQAVYDDIMESLAPIVMEQKPDGAIWWVGDGANGKSTLMDALYRIFPGQLSSLTVKRLTDGRDTPELNGTLANIVKESSEGRIDDTEIYKAIGSHEDFRVHKFHSQDSVSIRGNVHHIFSANAIPVFNDKGWSARRRTFIIPFRERFESDPTFEERTFTPKMFGRLIAEMCRYAVRLRSQGYRYKWSAVTLEAKVVYDTDANNAEEYARELIADGVVGFEGFKSVQVDYENWCGDNGYVPLGMNNLRRAMQTIGFARRSVRAEGSKVAKQYMLPDIKNSDLIQFSVGRPGLYTTPGFTPEPEPELKPEEVPVPKFDQVREKTQEPAPVKDIIAGRW
jgi:hypothetical protein